MGWCGMLEPNSEEELEFIRYLIKKYIPGLKSQEVEMPTVMFDNTFPKKKF
jgi:hypothetical protein